MKRQLWIALAVGWALVPNAACAVQRVSALTFDHYYDGPAVERALHDLADAYPKLTELRSIGKSAEERDIWLLTINNAATGGDLDKPGIYVDGAIHGNEIQATEVCLYLAWYLLSSYGENPVITELVDKRAFYIVPVVNVDGRSRFFTDAGGYNIGRTARVAHDDDRDGRADEDDYDDLDEDGEILQMRVADPTGAYRTHPDDPRVMIRKKPGEPGQWRLLGLEGIDNDGDGRLNEDVAGYLDMNRNYGFKWQPRYVQGGAGDFPMSTSNTRAVSELVVSKPNIGFNVAFHNYGGMLLRGPGSKLAGPYSQRDIAVYDFLGHEGERIIPGYRYLIGGKSLYTTHGDFDEWMFSNLGILGFVGELFMPQQIQYRRPGDPLEKGKGMFGRRSSDRERQKFNDALAHGEMYRAWKKFDHPQFGAIEIGGWRRFTTRIPPTFMLPELVHRNAALVLFIAKHSPSISLELLDVKPVAKDLRRIRVRALNANAIPTLSQQALRHNLARRDLFLLSGPNLEVVAGGIVQDAELDRVAYVEHRPERLLASVPSFGQTIVEWVVKGRGPATIKFDSLKAKNQTLRIDKL